MNWRNFGAAVSIKKKTPRSRQYGRNQILCASTVNIECSSYPVWSVVAIAVSRWYVAQQRNENINWIFGSYQLLAATRSMPMPKAKMPAHWDHSIHCCIEFLPVLFTRRLNKYFSAKYSFSDDFMIRAHLPSSSLTAALPSINSIVFRRAHTHHNPFSWHTIALIL